MSDSNFVEKDYIVKYRRTKYIKTVLSPIALTVAFIIIVLAKTKYGISLDTIVSIVAPALIALATFLLWRATNKMSENSIRPKIVGRQSSREERQKQAGSIGSEYVEKEGIYIENVGFGPALDGELHKLQNGEKKYIGEFVRIPPKIWPYFYPSRSYRQLEISPEETHTTIDLKYHDMNGKPYHDKLKIPIRHGIVPNLAVRFHDRSEMIELEAGGQYDIGFLVVNKSDETLTDIILETFISPELNVKSEEFPVSTQRKDPYSGWNIVLVSIDKLEGGKEQRSKDLHISAGDIPGDYQVILYPFVPGIGKLKRKTLYLKATPTPLW